MRPVIAALSALLALAIVTAIALSHYRAAPDTGAMQRRVQ
jgi:hypothetical protein